MVVSQFVYLLSIFRVGVDYIVGGNINRRDFSRLGVGALVAATLPKVAFAQNVTESTVEVITPK